ncbi:MAG: hypothetical protein AAF721_06840 [Myxococcota bacterium]
MNPHRPTAPLAAGQSGRTWPSGGWGAVALLAVFGCGHSEAPPAGACGGGECDVPSTKTELLAALDGLADPMAQVLRNLAHDDATVEGGWEAIVAGLGDEVGCGADTESSFVVLSNQALRPKGIINRCVDAPVDASRFFLIFEPSAEDDDLDGDAFRVAAWDDDAARYRRYQMVPTEDGEALAVSVEPSFCAGCHGGTARRDAWMPNMNEMTEPWAQWNAEPGFSSFQFDEFFPEHTRGPVFEDVADPERLDSAANLEPIIRAALSRVSTARVATRGDAADLDVALDLLRPVFCDETANFVSEIHDSGELNLDAVVDPGLRDAFAALGSWPWPWVTDVNLRIEPAEPGDSAIALVAIRGHAVVAAEAALRSRGVLSAEQLVAVRALDWTHPFASPLRCGLFEDAEARARSGEGAANAAQTGDNAALVAALFVDAMQAGGVSLLTDDPTTVVALADAEDADAMARLAAGDVASLRTDLTTLGETIASHIATLGEPSGRATLLDERNRRACLAQTQYPITPIIAELPACA